MRAAPHSSLDPSRNEQYQLVSTMPKLVLKDKAATLSEAGIKSSCALMVQPLV